MRLLAKTRNTFDRIVNVLAILGGVLVVFIMLLTCYEVLMRYWFNEPHAWNLEIVEYSLVAMTFLGAAWVLRNEKHVKMDIVLNRLAPKSQALLNMVASILGAFVSLVITWYGIQATLRSYHWGEQLWTPLEPPKWILLAIIPLFTFPLFIQFLRRTYKFLRLWRAS